MRVKTFFLRHYHPEQEVKIKFLNKIFVIVYKYWNDQLFKKYDRKASFISFIFMTTLFKGFFFFLEPFSVFWRESQKKKRD